MPEWARFFTGRTTLAVLLALSACLVVYSAWGGLDRPGLYHDEKAYVVQARIYAGLHWAEPSPPVPSLWEQVHVFAEPRFAARYPPGYPAVLAMGAALGRPGLMQVLLAGATAASLFLLGTRLVGKWTAFVATALWLSSPVNTLWRAGYFSESLTCFLWIAWSGLAWRYRSEGRRADLVGASLLVAFAGITRPVTALLLAFPLCFVVWPRWRTRMGRIDTAVAVAAGLVVCAVIPVWNHAVLDSWTTTPYAEYSARTFPFDMPTLQTDWSPAPRELPPDFEALAVEQRRPYVDRSVAEMPVLFLRRLARAGRDALPSDLAALSYLAPLGLLVAGAAGWVVLGTALLLVLGHITMPHPLHWTVYYLDVFPAVAFGAVLAVRRGLSLAAPHVPTLSAKSAYAPAVAFTTGVTLLVLGATSWAPESIDTNGWMRAEVDFRSGVCALPDGEKVVFVFGNEDATPHHSFVDNDPRWQSSDSWIVRAWTVDRHRALMAAAPERDAYLFDATSGWFVRMNADGTPDTNGFLHVSQTDRRAGRGIECA